jgi:hypothetical protein
MYGPVAFSDMTFDHQSATPRTVPIREHNRLDLNRPGLQDANFIPQQYARPLPRHSTEGFGRWFESNGGMQTSQSEHFLRRKTPNGVLNAAYDGTSVEQTERPHAMKHILLPVSEHFSVTGLPRLFGQDLSVNSPLPSFDTNYAFNSQLNSPIPKDMWSPAMQFGTESPNPWNNIGRPPMGQLDSVLNQLPIQTPQPMQYPPNGHMYGFMPQPLQPPFVPTALGSVPPAPFWPGGNNPLFLPVATQEMSFYSPNMSTWRPNTGLEIGQGASWPIANNGSAPVMQNYHQTLPSPYQSLGQDPMLMHPLHPPQQLLKDNTNIFTANMNVHGAPIRPYNSSSNPGHWRDRVIHPSSRDRSKESKPFPQVQPSRGLYLDEYGPKSENVSRRDRIYHQAVSIYVDLIKHLSKSRAFSSSSNSRGSGLQIRYPKPPRTSQDYSHPLPPQRHNSTGALTHTRPHLPSHHRHSYIESRDHASQMEARNHIQDPLHSRSLQWQQPTPHDSPLLRSPPPADRLRHLRREGTDPISSSTSLIPRQDHYPVQNALSALDMLTTLCEESGWSWIEGMLLGGSLAYALADYPKAFEWYSKILALDSRYVSSILN